MTKTRIYAGFAITAAAALVLSIAFPKNARLAIQNIPANAPSGAEAEHDLVESVLELQRLAEEALVWRTQALRFIDALREKDARGEPYSAKEIQLLHQGVSDYLSSREKLVKIARRYAWLAEGKRDIVFAPGTGSHALGPQERVAGRIDPLDLEGRLATRRLKVSLAAALILYDNYLIAIWPFQSHDKVRRAIDFDNSEQEQALRDITDSFVDRHQIQIAKRAISLFENEQTWRRTTNGVFAEDRDTQYLELLIRGSASYERIRDYAWYKNLSQRLRSLESRLRDSVNFFKDESLNAVSGVFGNTMGLVQFREGKLKAMPSAERAALKRRLKPLDVLLEKTPFRLTDKLIPGHFGHVAIWVGTPTELKQLGLWDHPAVKPHQAALLNGQSVIEALRPGVEINTLERFLDVDDIAVIRKRGLDRERTREHLIRAFKQVGKEYDFNFDVETDKRIVCSELAYVVFTEDKWPTKENLGRVTISPDHVADRARPKGAFDVVDLWHDGVRIGETDAPKFFSQLLDGEAAEIADLRRLMADHPKERKPASP